MTSLFVALGLAILIALFAQIFIGEVLRSPALVAIVLHRPLPALSVLFAALVAAGFSRAAAENPSGRWIPTNRHPSYSISLCLGLRPGM